MTVRQHFALGLNNQREEVWRATVIAAFDERDRASASPLIVVPRDAPGIPMQLQRCRGPQLRTNQTAMLRRYVLPTGQQEKTDQIASGRSSSMVPPGCGGPSGACVNLAIADGDVSPVLAPHRLP